jgi:hypothetical protein
MARFGSSGQGNEIRAAKKFFRKLLKIAICPARDDHRQAEDYG